MSKYEFKATNLLAETFEAHDVQFHVYNMQGQEALVSWFSVDGGPNVMIKFISRDNDNDVAVRIHGLISKTPKEKQARVMEACNVLNRKLRFLKFLLDTDGDINVEYDFPMHTADACIGEMAYEIFLRAVRILDCEYSIFMKALYTEEALDVRKPDLSRELHALLAGLRDDPGMPSDLRRRLADMEKGESEDSGKTSEGPDDEAEADAAGPEAAPAAAEESFAAFLQTLAGGIDTESDDPEDRL